MKKTTLAVKIRKETADKARLFCAERGVKYGFFVEKAIEEKLHSEELKEDLLDFKRLKCEEKDAIPFEDYLKLRDV